jgi:single-stranded DNA-specific DHH superfamily exonuclease
MLTNKEIGEIREHLDNAKNPVFFFDNDPDGLCSFLLLQRFIGKGRGVAIKSFPGLDKNYYKKVEEFNADYIFVLDKPIIDEDFIKIAEQNNIPLVHIDHHNVPKTSIKYYYNTFYSSGLIEPTSYLCYKVVNKKEEQWLCAIGCITDSFLPDFIDDFKKSNPDLIDYKYKDALDILYNTKLGKIAQVISFAMKDKTSNVVSMMKFLMKAQSATDIIEESPKTKTFIDRFNHVNERYQKLIKKAEESVRGDILFFTYSGDLSISQYTANEISHRHPGKVVVVAYLSSGKANVSLRWDKDIRTATVNAIKNIDGATGGGHEHSAGAKIPGDQLENFKVNLIREIEKINKS